jgi:hypothetical protein
MSAIEFEIGNLGVAVQPQAGPWQQLTCGEVITVAHEMKVRVEFMRNRRG